MEAKETPESSADYKSPLQTLSSKDSVELFNASIMVFSKQLECPWD